MKTLITGGAGFIGSAIFTELKNKGYDIFVVDNLSYGNRDFIDIDDNHFFKEDIRDIQELRQVFYQVQPKILIHLAAIHFIPYCNQHPFEAADINIRGTINILEASKAITSLDKIFFASTAAVYPIVDEAIKEDNELHPLDIYGLSKLTCEHICKNFWLETGTDTIICRFFNAFGPNETNPHLIPEIEKQLRSGQRTLKLGNLTPKRDFIHTYDMATAVAALLKLDKIGYQVFNLGRGIEYSVKEVVESFERQLGEQIFIESDPTRIRKVEREHLLANISKLRNLTDWEPKWSIDDGIRNIIDCWKK